MALNPHLCHFLDRYPDISRAYDRFADSWVGYSLPTNLNENLVCIAFIAGYRWGEDEPGRRAELDAELDVLREHASR